MSDAVSVVETYRRVAGFATGAICARRWNTTVR